MANEELNTQQSYNTANVKIASAPTSGSGTYTNAPRYDNASAPTNGSGMYTNTPRADATSASTPIRNQAEGAQNNYVLNYAQSIGGNLDNSQAINDMYNSALQGQLTQLQTANQINNANLEANRQALAKNYTQTMNAAATDYERNRMNLNTQLAGNGMNVGTGSQAALALSNQYQQKQGTINAANVQAQADLDRQIGNLNIQYQSDIAAAIAKNDYERAAALYNDMLNRQDQLKSYYQMALQDADRLASMGDFSMYGGLYGEGAQTQAQSEWDRARGIEDEDRARIADEYNRKVQEQERNNALQDAQIKAAQGDFSGYAQLYGAEVAAQMQAEWNRARQLEEEELQRERDTYQRNIENQQYQRDYNTAMLKAESGDFSGIAQLFGDAAAQQMQNEWNRARQYEDASLAAQQEANQLANEKNRYSMSATDAAQRAAVGDFSGYEALYGADMANMARQIWATQNPDLAYRQGSITPQEYQAITGQYPAGYTGASSNGYNPNFQNSYYSQKVLGNYVKDQIANGVDEATALNNYEAKYGKIDSVTMGKLGG
jgi:hypothetical protein